MGGRLTAEQRALRARAAAHASWARTKDRAARTAAGRAAALARIDASIPDDDQLSDRQRREMVAAARRAHFAKLALRSAKVRQRGMRGL